MLMIWRDAFGVSPYLWLGHLKWRIVEMRARVASHAPTLSPIDFSEVSNEGPNDSMRDPFRSFRIVLIRSEVSQACMDRSPVHGNAYRKPDSESSLEHVSDASLNHNPLSSLKYSCKENRRGAHLPLIIYQNQ